MIEDDKEYIQLLHMAMVGIIGLNKTLEIIAYANKLKHEVETMIEDNKDD